MRRILPRPAAPFAKLRRERPANNPIRESYLEMIAAPDAWNRLVTDLWGKSGTSVNVDLLFGFAA
jgi:hypothetical protein